MCVTYMVCFIQLSETNGSSFAYGYNKIATKPNSSDDTQFSEGKPAT